MDIAHCVVVCFNFILIPMDKIQAARFLEEITNSTIGLTGMRFFFLTRSLILSVAGTVVTYELVLVQFQILSPGRSKRLCGK